jgi:iron complex outermembrane receptor protein
MRTMMQSIGCALLALSPALASAQTSGQVSGQVFSERDGRPVAGAVVTIAGTSLETTTDGEGRFAFTDIAPGTHTVVISKEGFAALTESVTLPAGQTVSIEVRLPGALVLAEQLTVLGRLSDYIEATALAARSSARLIELPQAIAVLPARLLDDVGALDTKDLYRHISGVVDSPYSSTVVRGFTQREVLVNGVRGNPYGSLEGDVNISGFSTSQFRLTNVERVEILKGPASVLYGSGEPGGVINYVTRKPRDEFSARAVVGVGQYRQGLGQLDVTGPANAARSLLYRGAAYFEDRNHFRLNAEQRNTHLATGLAWKLTPRRLLGVEYEFIDQKLPGHRLRGVPVDATGRFLADYRWTATEPSDFTSLRAHVMQARLDESFARGLRLDATFRFLTYDRVENYHEPRGITGDGLFMQREYRDQLRTNDDWTLAANLSVPFSLGAIDRHDVAMGFDFTEQDHLFRFATALQQSRGGPVQSLPLANPVYGRAEPASYRLTAASFSDDTALSRRWGVYVQDLIALGAGWNVLIGGRIDRYDDAGSSAGVALHDDRSAATARAGLVFKPIPVVSLYGSYANGFTRPSILSQAPSANGPHEPETSDQVEVGSKAELAGGRLQVTAAFFHAVKRNVLRPDASLGPAGNNVNAVLPTGEVRNRGFEIDLAGQIMPAWNLAFNYAWLHARIAKDANASLVGKNMPNAAPHTVGLFSRVDLPGGVAVGISLQHVGDREEPFAGIRAPAYTSIDGHYYQTLTARVQLQVKGENLLNRRYAASSLFAARAGNVPGQPRTVSASLAVTFGRAQP